MNASPREQPRTASLIGKISCLCGLLLCGLLSGCSNSNNFASLDRAVRAHRWETCSMQGRKFADQKRHLEALEMFRAALAQASALPQPDLRLGFALDDLAGALSGGGDGSAQSEAQSLYEKALTLYQTCSTTAMSDELKGLRREGMIRCRLGLGSIYLNRREYAQSAQCFQAALRELTPQEMAEAPPLVRQIVVFATIKLADCYLGQNQYPAAERLYEQALQSIDGCIGVAALKQDISTNYSKLLRLTGRQEKSTEITKLFKQDTVDNGWRELQDAGRAAFSDRQLTKAESLCANALEEGEAIGPNAEEVISSLNQLALIYLAQGRLSQAHDTCTRALVVSQTRPGLDDEEDEQLLGTLSRILFAQQKYDLAKTILERQYEIEQRLNRTDALMSLENRARYAFVLNHLGDRKQAAEIAATVVAAAAAAGPKPRAALALTQIARLDEEFGNFADAERLYKSALDKRRQNLSKPFFVAEALHDLGGFYSRRNDYTQARAMYEEASAIINSKFPSDPLAATLQQDCAALASARMLPAHGHTGP